MATPTPTNQNSVSSDEMKKGTFLIAGFKVTDKAGGPELFVTGFTYKVDTVSSSGELKNKNYVFQKIFINIEKKTDKELFEDGDENEINNYHFFYDIADLWKNRDAGDNKFFFICKYWSKTESKFIYELKTYVEIESTIEIRLT